MRRFLVYAAMLPATLMLATPASATTVTLSAVSRGAYLSSGVFGTGASGTSTGNYLTGEYLFGTPIELRSFFVFDLSGVTDTIVSGTFELAAGSFLSVDASESVSLFDVSSSIAALTTNAGGVGAFKDLGTGTVYGSRVFTSVDPPFVPTTAILLNAAALSDLNAATGLLGIGGAVTSISGLSVQSVFGGTSGFGYTTQLVLETTPAQTAVPEPASMVLVGTGLAGMAARRYRRKNK